MLKAFGIALFGLLLGTFGARALNPPGTPVKRSCGFQTVSLDPGYGISRTGVVWVCE